ncbi:M1 family metallopeptidase [Nocardioides mangrovi]|uniref:Aminopeptidase N n=1 Tax=Nocardioides mangrovi TaxID=2874580 RepID=A0ABS7U7P4_9ACTN|nr:M1 family metallopeptidase [Nocardioides mangrovi]MBZ5737013.1 M1 family metallopeptidase [Nocardioides mangrovi]
MIRRTAALATAAAAALLLNPVVAPTAEGAEAGATWGAPGIGDPYFPLDGNGGIDVQRYEIHDRYDFDSRRLSGWTRVTLTATEDLKGFDLDFLLPVSKVTSSGRKLSFSRSGQADHELRIKLPLDAGEKTRLVVRYAGHPGRYSYEGESNWLADGHEVVAMNQPHMAPWWFPSNDHPLDKALVDIHVTVPKGKTVVANGTRKGRTVHGRLATTHWKADEPMVPYLAFFAAGPYAVAHGTGDDGTPWYVAVSKRLDQSGWGPGTEKKAMQLVKRTPELLSWLEQSLGDYPFSSTGGVITNLSPGFALENQTRPTYEWWGAGPAMVSTVVHELAHQWFGDSVAVHHWQDIWLNEGLATFFEDYWAEHLGDQTANEALRQQYDDRLAVDDFWHHEVADPCPEHDACVNWIFDGFVYQRGAMAIQALRNLIGDDDAFFALLRGWAAAHAGGNGSTAQFEAYAEEQTGLDLGGFFDAWLHSSTKPADTEANGLGDLSPAAG